MYYLHLFKLTLDERKTLTKVSTRTTSHNHFPKEHRALRMRSNEEAGKKKFAAVDLNNSEDAVMVGPTIRIKMERISISITHMTHNQNNMVLPAVYAVDSTIPPSTATRVNTT